MYILSYIFLKHIATPRNYLVMLLEIRCTYVAMHMEYISYVVLNPTFQSIYLSIHVLYLHTHNYMHLIMLVQCSYMGSYKNLLQQSSSSDPSSQSIRLLHHWNDLIHACVLLHLMSPGNGHDLSPMYVILCVRTYIIVTNYARPIFYNEYKVRFKQ